MSNIGRSGQGEHDSEGGDDFPGGALDWRYVLGLSGGAALSKGSIMVL